MADREYQTTVYEDDNCTITVRKPVLSSEEYEKAFNALKEQTVRYMRAYLKAKAQEGKQIK